MKFKILLFTFNIVLIGFLFIIFFLPFFYVDISFVNLFWKQNLIFIPIFLIISVLINFLLFRNKNIVEAIESEDWAALSMYLETEIFEKKHLSFKNVRLFLDSCFLLSDFNNATRLEKLLFKQKPQFIRRLAHTFAATKFLSQDFIELASFCQRIKNIGGEDAWILFYAGIAEFKQIKNNTAPQQMLTVISQTNDLFLQSLSAHIGLALLQNQPADNDKQKQFLAVYENIKTHYSEKKWQALINKATTQIRALVFIKLAHQVATDIYKKTS